MGTRDFYADFGQKLANLRENQGLTQAEFARKIGVSRASVANIERGEQRVYLHHLVNFAAALKLESISELTPRVRFTGVAAADVSISGDKLSRSQERTVKELVGSITASSRTRVKP